MFDTTTTAPATQISIDQATQLGLAINQQLRRPNLGAISPVGFSPAALEAAGDERSARAAILATPFDYFISVGLLTPDQASALTAVLLGEARPETLPPADPTAVSVYALLRIAVLRHSVDPTRSFWDVISDLAEVVAGAALGFIAAGPAGAVAGGAIAVVQVLSE